MRYKCIKEMCLPKCDGDVHLDSLNDDSDFGWLEMPFEELKENFVLIE